MAQCRVPDTGPQSNLVGNEHLARRTVDLQWPDCRGKTVLLLTGQGLPGHKRYSAATLPIYHAVEGKSWCDGGLLNIETKLLRIGTTTSV